MGDPTDMEALAAAEHESWANWSKYELRQIRTEIRESYGKKRRGERSQRDRAAQGAVDAFDALPCVQRWTRQAETPYVDLTEKEKESDRDVVRKKLAVYRGCTCGVGKGLRADHESQCLSAYLQPRHKRGGV